MCSIRRVKCDEQTPACRRCVSTGRKCDGYTALPFTRRDLEEAAARSSTERVGLASADHTHDHTQALIPRLMTDPAFGNLAEKRYFQFFRLKTIPSTNSVVDCRFWDRVVLQACHIEPAIKHAILALSSWHQLSYVSVASDVRLQHRQYAEEQHHKALGAARALIGSATAGDVDRILIACVIFVIFENVRGDYTTAAMHLESGRAIVAQHAPHFRQKGRRRDLNEIEQAFARLDLFALCLSDDAAPPKHSIADFHETGPNIRPERFEDVGEAQACLIDLSRWFLHTWLPFQGQEHLCDSQMLAEYQEQKTRCAQLAEIWHQHLQELVTRLDQEDSPAVLNMRCWYAVMSILMKLDNNGPETQYDSYTDLFEESLQCAQQLSDQLLQEEHQARTFSYDLGYLMSIYLCATKCRDPGLRRRAIGIMQSHPRQEGVWESTAAAAVAIQCVIHEEEGLGTVTCAQDIPESQRVQSVDQRIDMVNHTAYLRLIRRGVAEAYTVVVSWNPNGPGGESFTDSSAST